MEEKSQKHTFEDLKHVRRQLSDGGKVVVLDTGARITPEAEAMIQALHSRSIGGIDAHLATLARKGVKDFMDKYYIGYGDKSIGDCGSCTVFVEGGSMLAAKALQDFWAYNGQEASTRYIKDFASQPFLNPHGSREGASLLEACREFYLTGIRKMREYLAVRHPYDARAGEEEMVWQKAINARAFDVMRGFLPAGCATNLSVRLELRHMADHVQRLRNHPLPEVREIAVAMHDALSEMYPHSFTQKRYEATEAYLREMMHAFNYFDFSAHDVMLCASLKHASAECLNVVLERDMLQDDFLSVYARALSERPPKTELPKRLAECGMMRFSFFLDFGSFRDLQRHRSVIQQMPMLTTRWGFEDWYYSQMPPDLQDKAHAFCHMHEQRLKVFEADPIIKQYYTPMGYRTACRLTGDLSALFWIIELRSGISVHPTLRAVAQEMGRIVRERLKAHGAKIYIDETPDRFNIKRGHQDIVEKTSI